MCHGNFFSTTLPISRFPAGGVLSSKLSPLFYGTITGTPAPGIDLFLLGFFLPWVIPAGRLFDTKGSFW